MEARVYSRLNGLVIFEVLYHDAESNERYHSLCVFSLGFIQMFYSRDPIAAKFVCGIYHCSHAMLNSKREILITIYFPDC